MTDDDHDHIGIEMLAIADEILDSHVAQVRDTNMTTPGIARALANTANAMPQDRSEAMLCMMLATAIQRLAHPEQWVPKHDFARALVESHEEIHQLRCHVAEMEEQLR